MFIEFLTTKMFKCVKLVLILIIKAATLFIVH